MTPSFIKHKARDLILLSSMLRLDERLQINLSCTGQKM